MKLIALCPQLSAFAVVVATALVVSVACFAPSLATELPATAQSAAEPAADEPAVDALHEQARNTVRMLDDIYKGGVVAITDTYVTDESSIPAGTAFKSLFKAAEAKGWHKVRLLDATGEPYSDENVSEDDFERNAVKELVAGKPWVEAIEVRNGTKHLRVATAIPVVMEKCVMCHDNYADVPKGQAIGALSYTVPFEGKLQQAKK